MNRKFTITAKCCGKFARSHTGLPKKKSNSVTAWRWSAKIILAGRLRISAFCIAARFAFRLTRTAKLKLLRTFSKIPKHVWRFFHRTLPENFSKSKKSSVGIFRQLFGGWKIRQTVFKNLKIGRRLISRKALPKQKLRQKTKTPRFWFIHREQPARRKAFL